MRRDIFAFAAALTMVLLFTSRRRSVAYVDAAWEKLCVTGTMVLPLPFGGEVILGCGAPAYGVLSVGAMGFMSIKAQMCIAYRLLRAMGMEEPEMEALACSVPMTAFLGATVNETQCG